MNKEKKKNNLLRKNLILGFLVVVITITPLIFLKNADFTGSDEKAENEITEINKNYKPWFSSLWEPPSGEIETLIFSLQAAIGAGFIGYYFGYQRGKSKKSQSEKS